MKLMQRKHITRWILSAMFVLGMIFSMKSVTAFAADEETQTIYIGGNKLTVPIVEASYWNYNEVDGTITACAEQEANVLINTVGKYGAPASSIYVNLINVNIKAKGGTEDSSNAGIYNPEQETKMYLRINGACSVTGSKYGIYAKIDVTPCDEEARLTITADSSLAPEGVDVPQAISLYSIGANYIYRGCGHTDFSVILRSDTMTTIKGGGDFTCQSTKASVLTSPNMDGSDATEYIKENGIFNLGDMSRIKYREYKNGTLMYDKAKITGATLKFHDGDAPAFTATVSEEDAKLIAEEILTFDEVAAGNDFSRYNNSGRMKPRRENTGKPEFTEGDLQVWVCFDDRKEYDELEKEFLSILEEYKGNCPVYIFIKQEKQYKNMGRGFMVDGASGIVDRLKLEYGVSRVTVRPNKKK